MVGFKLVSGRMSVRIILFVLISLVTGNGFAADVEKDTYKRQISIGIPLMNVEGAVYADQKGRKELVNFLETFWLKWGDKKQYDVKLVHAKYDELLEQLQQGRIDALSVSTYNEAKLSNLSYSIPYIEIQAAAYRRIGTRDGGDSVGLILPESIFPPNFNEKKSVLVHDEDIKTVLKQSSDLNYLYGWSDREIRFSLYQHDLVNDFVKIEEESGIPMRVVTLNSRQDLLVEINRAIREMKTEDFSEILGNENDINESYKALVGSYTTSISLEQEFDVLKRPVVTFAYIVDGEEPYFLTDNLFLEGYITDVMTELTKVTGVTFVGRAYYSFQEALEAVSRNEVDLFPGIYKTDFRSKRLNFSLPIDRSVLSIVGEQDYYAIKELQGLRIALVKGMYENEIVSGSMPTNPIIYLDTAEEAIEAVASGIADVYVGKLLNNAYLINSLGLHTLKLHRVSDFDIDFFPRIASPKENDALIGLINVGLISLGEQFQHELQMKWKKHLIFSRDEERVQALYEQLAMFMAIGLIVLMVAFSFYRKQLRRRRDTQLTLEKALFEAKQATLRAEELTLAKSDFLARMSHEIRTPMNGVLGMAEALSFTRLDNEQNELLKTLNSSARNLMALLNDVLDFSKMDAGKLALEFVRCELEPVLTNVIGNFKHKANAKALSLNSRTDVQLNKYYICDSTRLMQVLNNLVSNSVKFTNEGFIELSAHLVKEQHKQDEDGQCFDLVSFQVRDSGIGIKTDKIDTLFDPFVQADGDITRRFGGSGLGLSICQEIISEMGGEITVSSKLGRGSVFTILVPLQVDDNENRYQKADLGDDVSMNDLIGGTALTQLKVLFAEDNAVNRKVIGGQLERLGVAYDVAENGRIAYLKYCENPSYDVVLSDCHMPEMDGFTLVSTLKAEHPNSNARYIAITADALSGAATRCLEAGFDDYISKPCPIDILESKLAAAATEVLDNQSDFDRDDSQLSDWLDSFEVTTTDFSTISDGVDSEKSDLIPHDDWMTKLNSATEESLAENETIELQSLASDANKALELPPLAPFNIQHVLEASGGLEDIAYEILDTFLQNVDEDLNEFKDAVHQQDPELIRSSAHKIKGSALYLGDQPLATVAKRLEGDAKHNDLTHLSQCSEFISDALTILSEQVHHALIDTRG